MYEWILWSHQVAAIYWLGGMTLMLWAVRPAALGVLAPAQRLPLMAEVLRRFFAGVWVAIAVLLGSGLWMFASAEARLAPRGWHVMAGLGLVMVAIFGHLYFSPWRRMRQALAAQDLPAAGRALAGLHPWVLTNAVLGWLAVTAVQVWR